MSLSRAVLELVYPELSPPGERSPAASRIRLPRIRSRRAFAVLFCLLLASMLQGQQLTPPWTRYCLQLGGFCFDHPAGWRNLGPIYNGVVFAEPNKERPQTDWNHITAAALDLPEPAEGSERPSMNDLINQVMMPPEGAAIHTVERMETVVGGYPAQVITAEVQEQGKPVAIEQVAFIDADDVLYTVALRCAPADYRRLKPVFQHVLRSWREMPPPPSQPPAAPNPGGEQPK